jgi:large subunit ribosomal protein L4
MSPAETSGAKPSTAKAGAAKAGNAEAGAAKSRTAQAGAAKPSTAQAGAAKPRTAQAGAAKPSTAQAGAAKSRTAQAGAAKPSTAKARPAQAGAAKPSTAKARPAKGSSTKSSGAPASDATVSDATASDVTASTSAGDGQGSGAADLPAEIFDAKVNVPLIHQVVVAQEAAARQGTHATKTRGAVRGGGRKPYRQKGTGRARQGSIRAPQFAGGGTVHGPQPRSYEQRTPKKMKAAALRGALSDRARHGRVHVVSGLLEGDAPRTRDALAALAELIGMAPASSPVLVVADASDSLTWKSLRNARGVHLLDSGQLNTRDVLVSDHVVFTKGALDKFVARATRGAKQEVDSRD